MQLLQLQGRLNHQAIHNERQGIEIVNGLLIKEDVTVPYLADITIKPYPSIS
jgi:hypothetical protein